MPSCWRHTKPARLPATPAIPGNAPADFQMPRNLIRHAYIGNVQSLAVPGNMDPTLLVTFGEHFPAGSCVSSHNLPLHDSVQRESQVSEWVGMAVPDRGKDLPSWIGGLLGRAKSPFRLQLFQQR